MDCRETQALLTAFHDGELPAVDRVRVEEHLRICPVCGALLADLARADRAVGVPDPGPAYWDRFNARVMERVERETDGPGIAILRPKHGWMRQQLRYLVPAAAAAALVVVIVRFGGMFPGAPTPTAVSEPSAPGSAGERMAKAGQDSHTAKSGMVARRTPPQVLTDERLSAVTRADRDRPTDRQLSGANEDASRERTSPPAPFAAPSAPAMTFRGADGQGRPSAGTGRDAPGSVVPADGQGRPSAGTGRDATDSDVPVDATNRGGSAATARSLPRPVPAKERSATTTREERDRLSDRRLKEAKEEGAAARMAEQQVAGKAESASSPCELARTLAGRKRIREAEVAQRACLAENLPEPAREKGLVFLAELLDRQARFAEADAVITEVDRRFPQSRPLDLYRQQRTMVQKQPLAVPVTR